MASSTAASPPPTTARSSALEEGAVADRAVGDAAAGELLLAGDVELARVAAGGDDDRRRAVLAGVGLDHLHAVVLDADAVHRRVHHLGAEVLGLGEHHGGEVAAEDALEAGVVLDQLGVEQLAAGGLGLDDHGADLAAAGVEGGGETGRAGADDGDVVLVHSPCDRTRSWPPRSPPAARLTRRGEGESARRAPG